MKITIMTFNVLNGWNTSKIGMRDDLAASAILSKMPDVIGFQELDPFYRLADNSLPLLISEHYVEASNAQMSWNPIFYKKDRFNLIDSGEQVFEKGTVYVYPKGGYSGFRTVNYALLEDISSKESFIVFNLHYDFNKDCQITTENQLFESDQVISLAQKLVNKYGVNALFVTGDYNSKIDGTACVNMLQHGFTDTHRIALKKDDKGTCAKLGADLFGDYEGAAIDHVFYIGERALRVNEYETVDNVRDASDHSPVLVTVELDS